MMDIGFYCGIAEWSWCGLMPEPGPYACISPVCGRSEKTKRFNAVQVPSGVKVIQDSGAFSDSWSQRLTFDEALKRQELHAEQYKYADKLSHRATYDLLIDEVWNDGNRHKRRWSVEQAESAVETTVQSAKFLNEQRNGLPLIISAQGVDAAQYLRCTQKLMPYFQDGDVLGFGGWCIIGKMPKVMLPIFLETIQQVIPFAASEGIKRVHIWGVIYAKALGPLLWECKQHGIEVSTDSVGPSVRPALGSWGYAEWRDNTYAALKRKGVELGLDRITHVELTRDWLARFSTTRHFKPYQLKPQQMALF